MQIVPITTKAIVVVAALTLLPLLPLALTESSIWDILKMIGGSLF